MLEASWRLPAELSTAARARALTRQTLRGWGVPEGSGAEDVVLLVDELVTNAVVHGGGRVRLLLRVEPVAGGWWLTGEVGDGSPVVPAGGVRAVELSAEAGRGLWLVAMLAAEHGVRPVPGGKTLWFCVPLSASNGEL